MDRRSILRRLVKVMKWVFVALLLIIVLLIGIVLIARLINWNKTKIKTENGIQESEYIEIGGIQQYIQIKGENTDNPIIVFLHGGPGSPMSYVSYYYQEGLESDYTFVNYDQRGCGRTYYANEKNTAKLTKEVLLNDLDELIDYLRERFGQEKVIIMGHSWGTVLGTLYIKEHPEKISEYIGIGQVINLYDGKIYTAERALEITIEKGNDEDANRLKETIDVAKSNKKNRKLDLNNLISMITLTQKYLASDGEISPLKQMWLGISSSYMSIEDIRWFMVATNTEKLFKLQGSLIDYAFWDFNLNEIGDEYEVPVYYISGDGDYSAPYELVKEYYQNIKAPSKEYILLKNVGHSPFMDNPKVFKDAVRNLLSSK